MVMTLAEKCYDLGLERKLKFTSEGILDVDEAGKFEVANVAGDGNFQFRKSRNLELNFEVE